MSIDSHYVHQRGKRYEKEIKRKKERLRERDREKMLWESRDSVRGPSTTHQALPSVSMTPKYKTYRDTAYLKHFSQHFKNDLTSILFTIAIKDFFLFNIILFSFQYQILQLRTIFNCLKIKLLNLILFLQYNVSFLIL